VWYSLLQLQGSAQQCRPTTLDAMQLCSKIPSSRCAECSSAPKYPAPAQQLLLFEQGQRISINVATTKHSAHDVIMSNMRYVAYVEYYALN
jgi:hypothetical protein